MKPLGLRSTSSVPQVMHTPIVPPHTRKTHTPLRTPIPLRVVATSTTGPRPTIPETLMASLRSWAMQARLQCKPPGTLRSYCIRSPWRRAIWACQDTGFPECIPRTPRPAIAVQLLYTTPFPSRAAESHRRGCDRLPWITRVWPRRVGWAVEQAIGAKLHNGGSGRAIKQSHQEDPLVQHAQPTHMNGARKYAYTRARHRPANSSGERMPPRNHLSTMQGSSEVWRPSVGFPAIGFLLF
ncbi:hypothetical protein PHLGIDRAFT_363605 [Phlebiopsis gigantea 11061_1 CR5-6]|uniref:Uncharacterized protein n=1 Tax=Phlebiopsis gigantea (strain 11061_1 CR5-6) TaxID=745531 RepID=A0A0C3NTX4_PHLG1|nr:hypothetical protein PHLGIDRAFT_363605 [Phlebiopsis gigantea 11061_1 CR5-6]